MINNNPNFNSEVPANQLDLPKMVQDVVQHFDPPLQRKMATASVLTIVGALLPKVHLNYDNGRHYPSLYTVIVLPPASGKGSTGKIEIVLNPIVEEQIKENKSKKAKFKRELKAYERALREGQDVIAPVEPSYPLLKIPGNTTSAKQTEQLSQNNGKMFVLICEAEIDAFTNMLGNGMYGKDNSMIARKVYHNESVSIMRKNGDHFDIQSPKMAIVLTGTPSQLSSLFRSIQDGLFSRFLVVEADVPLVWKNVQPCDTCSPIETKLAAAAPLFYDFYKRFSDREVEFKLTDEHWSKINEFGEQRLRSSFETGGEYATSVAKRHAVMIARTACILSMMRYHEADSEEQIWTCNDTDFETALTIVSESYESSIKIFQSLNKEQPINDQVESLFDRLPMRFKTKELSPLMNSLNISQRTLHRYLDALIKMGKLSQVSKGNYEKHVMAEMADGSYYSQNAPLDENGELKSIL